MLIATRWVPGVDRPPYIVPITPKTKSITEAMKSGIETAEDIAKAMGVHKGTARWHLYRMRREGLVVATETAGKPTKWRLK